MNPKWCSDLTVTEVQQGSALLSSLTNDNAPEPEDIDQLARAFAIKVLFEGEDTARQFVAEIEKINRAKRELLHANPSASEHERWFLKIGRMATSVKNSRPLLPESYQRAIREMEDSLTNEFQLFAGDLQVLKIRGRFFRPNAGDPPSPNTLSDSE